VTIKAETPDGSAGTSAQSGNRLSGESSPYLLQHRDNPVHWQPWGEAAFAQARAENKPVLLSVGYAACHWCHVMAHESFENESVADLMNRLFVNIKVDREERPDLDGIYQNALAILGEQGGWPLTMFLTPKGEPFWGGTYFPPEPRYGRPGFPQVLQALSEAYHGDPEKIASNVTAIQGALQKLSNPAGGGAIDAEMLERVSQSLGREIDPINGGIGQAPKFPQPAILKLLWRGWKRTANSAYRDAVLLSLAKMSQGGIYDHLGGGYARYATDNRWLVPHFEKMLYDNAQLLDLLTLAIAETGDPFLAERREETIGWLLREMIAEDAEGQPSGAFAATLDADSEGEEGRYYVWSAAEIDSLLEAELAALFKQVYDVSPGGNWEGNNILNRTEHAERLSAQEEERLSNARATLFEAREKRVRPGWDDKVLTDWNGMMIAALGRAAFAAGRSDWLEAARRAYRVVVDLLDHGGRFHHSWRRGILRSDGTLDDYAQMIDAALTLHELTGEDRYLRDARRWLETLERLFEDKEKGGFFLTAADAEDLIVRPKHAHDNATPAGNGVIAAQLVRLFFLTGERAYAEKAERCIAAFTGNLEREFYALPSIVSADEFLKSGRQIVVVGETGDPDREALIDVLRAHPDLHDVRQLLAPSTPLPESHPAHGKGLKDGKAAAYLCQNQSCSLPITDPAALASALQGRQP
jgi:uncharacterized protein YyaL (SSP411 family)